MKLKDIKDKELAIEILHSAKKYISDEKTPYVCVAIMHTLDKLDYAKYLKSHDDLLNVIDTALCGYETVGGWLLQNATQEQSDEIHYYGGFGYLKTYRLAWIDDMIKTLKGK